MNSEKIKKLFKEISSKESKKENAEKDLYIYNNATFDKEFQTMQVWFFSEDKNSGNIGSMDQYNYKFKGDPATKIMNILKENKQNYINELTKELEDLNIELKKELESI